jgi:hypothetical protein
VRDAHCDDCQGRSVFECVISHARREQHFSDDADDLLLTVTKAAKRMLDDIRSILTRARARDARELAAYGLEPEEAALAFASPAILARVFAHEARATAIVAFHRLTSKALVVSMMATDEWPCVARAVLRWGWREARPTLIAAGYERAECRTIDGHVEAIELLERLGFVRECLLPRFGADGASFLQYAWRLIDHVPVQLAQSAAPAATAADAGLKAG